MERMLAFALMAAVMELNLAVTILQMIYSGVKVARWEQVCG
jgi:hypothetical protein